MNACFSYFHLKVYIFITIILQKSFIFDLLYSFILSSIRFSVNGSFWEDMIPFFNSKTGKYLTVHPTFNLVPWIISDYFASLDLSQATIKTHDRGGIICPWEPEGLVWEYNRE